LGSGSRDKSVELRVWNTGCRAKDSEFLKFVNLDLGLGFRARMYCLGFRVQGLGLRIEGLRFRV